MRSDRSGVAIPSSKYARPLDTSEIHHDRSMTPYKAVIGFFRVISLVKELSHMFLIIRVSTDVWKGIINTENTTAGRAWNARFIDDSGTPWLQPKCWNKGSSGKECDSQAV